MLHLRKKILAISGSTRTNSSNFQLLNAIASLSADRWDVDFYQEIAELPYFNPDLDREEPPAAVGRFRQKIQEADGVIICTPEYVFSLPGALKNALEWTVSTVVFSEKPTALIVASASGQKAYESLILIMSTLGVKLTEQTTLLIQGARSKLNSQGQLADENTLQAVKQLIDSLSETMETSSAITGSQANS
jgi:chromate reductase, NAD(P)H dehydrogenase (quinone)